MIFEIIFKDNENTIKQEENYYYEGLLHKKFLYTDNKITKVFEYEYNDKELINTKEYDYNTYCQVYKIYTGDFKKIKNKKRKKLKENES